MLSTENPHHLPHLYLFLRRFVLSVQIILVEAMSGYVIDVLVRESTEGVKDSALLSQGTKSLNLTINLLELTDATESAVNDEAPHRIIHRREA